MNTQYEVFVSLLNVSFKHKIVTSEEKKTFPLHYFHDKIV